MTKTSYIIKKQCQNCFFPNKKCVNMCEDCGFMLVEETE